MKVEKKTTSELPLSVLPRLSEYCNNKPFRDITRDELQDFLNERRKIEDPKLKWIGTITSIVYLYHAFSSGYIIQIYQNILPYRKIA